MKYPSSVLDTEPDITINLPDPFTDQAFIIRNQTAVKAAPGALRFTMPITGKTLITFTSTGITRHR
jgi:hypothetical protein